MSLIRIDESDDFVVDYDKERGMYRVSVFDDGHFWDEFWFNEYKEKNVSLAEALNKFCETPLINPISPKDLKKGFRYGKKDGFYIIKLYFKR